MKTVIKLNYHELVRIKQFLDSSVDYIPNIRPEEQFNLIVTQTEVGNIIEVERKVPTAAGWGDVRITADITDYNSF